MPKERYARCFASGMSVRGRDFVLLRVEDARRMVDDGLAMLVNHCRDIQMFSRSLLRLRQSFIYSTNFMHGVAMGDPYCLRVWDWFRTRCSPRWKSPVSISNGPNTYEMPMDAEDGSLLEELQIGSAA